MKKFLALLIILVIVDQSAQAQKKTATPDYKKDVEKLAKSKGIIKAFETIDGLEAKGIEELIMLTEIEAPPFKEERRAAQFKKMLEAAGADKVWIDKEGNVLAQRKGKTGGRTVVLDAHLDTVFPEGTDVKVKMKGDTMVAPGIGDDTRGLIVALNVLRALEGGAIETEADLLIVGSVGEEGLGDLRGVKYIFEKGDIKIDSWISIDGEEINRVVNGGLGSIRYKVTFEGPGGHSWGAFGLANPHHALGKAIDYFSEEASKLTATGLKTSFNVGRIGGGTSVNAIPFESWMEVDMRSVDPTRLTEIDDVFKKAMNKALTDYNASRKSGPALTLKVEMIGSRPSGVEALDLPLLQKASAAIRYMGAEPAFTTGSTNSNIPISKGIPAVTIGRGGEGGGAHSLDEWWINTNGDDAIKMALLLVVLEAGMSK